MIVDAKDRASPEDVETDVCIVGSGPAGITLARELSGQSMRVCVLESGDFGVAEGATHALSEVDHEGTFAQVNPDQRNRRFGGNASFWGVQLKHSSRGVRLIPFQASDFERREGVPYSGWPFTREQLEPFYARAQAALGAGPYRYDLHHWTTREAQPFPFADDSLQTSMFMFGNGDVITREYRREMHAHESTTVYCNANAVELATDETGQWVRRVRVATVAGRGFWVNAKLVILAAGGVENAQLLLLSNKTHQHGIGNAHDLVGRFFMDHPIIEAGHIIPNDRGIFDRAALYDKRNVDGACVMGGLTLSDRLVRERQLLNLTSWLFPRPLWYWGQEAQAARHRLTSGQSFARGVGGVWQDAKRFARGAHWLVDSLRNKLEAAPPPAWPNLATGGWSEQQANKARAFGLFELVQLVEQAPDPENRVVLSDRLDVLGRRRSRLVSRWREADQRGVDVGQGILDQALRAAGLGRFEPRRGPDGELIFSSLGAAHHMGTTRMDPSPRQGVVDEHCRVHGVNNLFVAGSSVFPTGSSLNPTLTIVALAARLADHVKLRLERELAA